MNIWVLIPSANPKSKQSIFDLWMGKGYKLAVLGPGEDYKVDKKIIIPQEEYKGTPWALGKLYQHVVADLYGFCGDDVTPDPEKTAEEVGEIYKEHFPRLDGVLTPTGDPFTQPGLCQHPWIGKEFARTINAGTGPFYQGYSHFYADRELHNVALMEGKLVEEKRIFQAHHHWTKLGQNQPEHMKRWKKLESKDKKIFERRRADGFPGSQEVVWCKKFQKFYDKSIHGEDCDG